MINIIHRSNALYPARLREVQPRVMALYVRGALRASDWQGIAIIGARQPHHPDAKARAERIARSVVDQGYTVISGMALGCDSWAQAAAIAAGGRTIGVLAGDVQTAAEGSRWLGPEIASHGALVSERPPGYQLSAADFVPRDRIITGAALAVIVIDADITGGTMKAVEWAAQQGRPVLAVPGSPGCDLLIKSGRAKAITTPTQLEALLKQLASLSAISLMNYICEPQARAIDRDVGKGYKIERGYKEMVNCTDWACQEMINASSTVALIAWTLAVVITLVLLAAMLRGRGGRD